MQIEGMEMNNSEIKKELQDTCGYLAVFVCANIMLDRELVGIIGRVHPSLKKDDIYVFEISLNKLMKNIKPIKFTIIK